MPKHIRPIPRRWRRISYPRRRELIWWSGLPLGLGKANHIINALYARAVADRQHQSDAVFRADAGKTKTLQSAGAPLHHACHRSPVRFGYPDLAYADALHAGELPPNVRVIEFFFLAGKWLHVPFAQQHYISANYTHAASYLLARGLNVVHPTGRQANVIDGVARYSLSCNTDTTLDVLRARAQGDGRVQARSLKSIPNCRSCRAPAICRPRNSVPFWMGPATDFPLCSRRRPSRSPTPNTPSACTPRAWCAMAVRLQIGIGQVGDALAQGLDRASSRQCAILHDIIKRLQTRGGTRRRN